MIVVNKYHLDLFLNPLCGGAFVEKEVEYYSYVSTDNEKSYRLIIETLLLPHYNSIIESIKMKMKNSLKYYLNKQDFCFEKVFESNDIPFDPPDDPKSFFIWLWEGLYMEESYEESNVSHYKESNNYSDRYIKYIE